MTTAQKALGIREVSELTGLSVDTLRWYEKEGLLPSPPRGADGRRSYSDALVGFVRLIVALRRTGMPVADVREFVRISGEGAASHGRRLAMLDTQRVSILERQVQLNDDLAAVEYKIEHYRELIAAGLDCEGLPVDDETAARQQRTDLPEGTIR